jgi:RNA polymerase sigma-70 factor (ECF subfamily)
MNNQLPLFEEMALPLMSQLFAFALNLTRNANDAEDLVQNTYLRAWRFFEKFQTGTNFKNWISKILVNIFINNHRRKKHVQYENELDNFTCSAWDLQPEFAQPDHTIDDIDSYFEDPVIEALADLPDRYRIAILLCDVYDFKYKEIAEILNVPIGTVMSRINRGRKMLAARLNKYASEAGYISSSSNSR